MSPKRRRLNPPATTSHDPDPDPEPFTLPFPDKPHKTIYCLRHAGPQPPTTTNTGRLVFTHGAGGGGLASAGMQDFSHGFARVAAGLVSFAGTLHLGSRVRAFEAVVANEGGGGVVALGGRSMGARAAAMVASAAAAERTGEAEEGEGSALVLVSFPLVSAKGERREEVLRGIPEGTDVLFVTGERDGMCDVGDLQGVIADGMRARSWLVVVEGADHGMELKGKRAGGREVREKTGEIAARWLESRDAEKRYARIRWNGEEGRVDEDGWRSSSGEEEVEEGGEEEL